MKKTILFIFTAVIAFLYSCNNDSTDVAPMCSDTFKNDLIKYVAEQKRQLNMQTRTVITNEEDYVIEKARIADSIAQRFISSQRDILAAYAPDSITLDDVDLMIVDEDFRDQYLEDNFSREFGRCFNAVLCGEENFESNLDNLNPLEGWMIANLVICVDLQQEFNQAVGINMTRYDNEKECNNQFKRDIHNCVMASGVLNIAGGIISLTGGVFGLAGTPAVGGVLYAGIETGFNALATLTYVLCANRAKESRLDCLQREK